MLKKIPYDHIAVPLIFTIFLPIRLNITDSMISDIWLHVFLSIKTNIFLLKVNGRSDEVVKDFAVDAISPGVLRQIVETAIQYSIEFDLLVPPYDQVKMATVEQMRQKMSHSKMVTAKRLGFSFNSDDV